MDMVLVAILCGLAAVAYGLLTTRAIVAAPAGNARMQTVAAAIQEGAGAYLAKQYSTIAIVGVVVAALVGVFLGLVPAIGFLLGAILSGAAGYIGMLISVRANVRTAEAARGGLQNGLTMAFRSGAVTGMLVAGLALLAIAGFFFVMVNGGADANSREVINGLVALS
ncbi:MAG: sodium/proton-translocating pyrophosphatase, partial [Sphingomonadaceae bacterium]